MTGPTTPEGRACPECGYPADDDAWCGACGARLAGRPGATSTDEPAPAVVAEDRPALVLDADAGPGPVGRDARGGDAGTSPRRPARRGALVAVLGLLVLAVVTRVAGDDAGPAGTLGHVDRPPALVADAPLPLAALQPVWEIAGEGPAEVDTTRFGVGAVRSAGEALVVGDLVFDRDGTVAATAVPGVPVPGGRVVRAVGDRLEEWDEATGRRLGDRPLALPDGAGGVDPIAAFTDGTLVGQLLSSDEPPTVLSAATVAPDGTVTGIDVPGRPRSVHGDRLVLVEVARVSGFDRPGDLVWIDVTSGDRVPVVSGGHPDPSTLTVGDHVVWLDDDHLVALSADGELTRGATVGNGETTWDDLALVGGPVVARTGPDEVVLAGRVAGESTLHLLWQAVPGPGVGAATRLVVPVPDGTLVGAVGDRPRDGAVGPGDAAVVDGLAVVLDRSRARLAALDRDGTTVWSVEVAPDASVVGAGGVVVVLSSAPDGQRITLLRGADGAAMSATTVPGYGPTGFRWVVGDRVGTLTERGVVDVRDGRAVATVDGRVVDGATPDGVSAPVVGVVEDPRTREQVLLTPGAGTLRVGATTVDPGALGRDEVRRRPVAWERGATLFEESAVAGPGSAQQRSRLVVVARDGRVVAHPGLGDASWWSQSALGRVLAGRGPDGLVLLDAATGAQRLRVPGALVATRASPDRLVVSGRSAWWVVDDGTGRQVGPPRPMLGVLPGVGDGLVAWSRPDGAVELVDTVDGSTRWVHEAGPVAPPVVAFAGDHVLVGTRDGRLLQLDAVGERVRELTVGEGPVRAVAWAAGTLVVDVDGVVRGLRAAPVDGRGDLGSAAGEAVEAT